MHFSLQFLEINYISTSNSAIYGTLKSVTVKKVDKKEKAYNITIDIESIGYKIIRGD